MSKETISKKSIYCWTVRWQERGHHELFRHFYPKSSGKTLRYYSYENEVKAFIMGVQTNTNIQHSSLHTIYLNSVEHKAMIAASKESSAMIEDALRRKVQPE